MTRGQKTKATSNESAEDCRCDRASPGNPDLASFGGVAASHEPEYAV
jgi:hypothetical protein